MKTAPQVTGDSLHLPDFCDSRATLAIVLIVELTAIMLTLAHESAGLDFWTDLTRTSVFLLWVGLASAGALCVAAARLARMSVPEGSALVLLLTSALVALISYGTYLLGRTELMAASPMGALFPSRAAAFVLRNVTLSLLITAVALRYFYVTHQWRRNVEMQALARVNALQARIRPHFLFNSMNTIAALTRSNPALAEQAVQDLADLFRATLSEQRSTITFAEELEVARTYQRIEELRLGERLKVEWQIEPVPAKALVPGLLLQPLLENAIYHGIEPRAQGGTVRITGELGADLITVVVRNPLAEQAHGRPGNRLALANIRERLTLMYGERALLKAGRFDSEYIVTLRFPHLEQRQAS